MKEIILASGSPRRIELMKLLNVDFKVIPANIDENLDNSLSIVERIENLAYFKAKYVFDQHPESIVIGADSIVYQNNQILNKPKDYDDAYQMIKSYSNNYHSVITGVSILSKAKVVKFSSVCHVYFNKISDVEIKDYLNREEYLDKAVAYAIQNLMAKHIKKIEGDYYTVVGFPISKIYSSLKEDFKIF